MLGELIAERGDEILGVCREKLSLANPGRGPEELVSELPAFLDEVRRALLADEGAPTRSPLPGSSESAAQHGEHRFAARFRPWDIVQDYGFVCDSVSEVAIRHGVTPSVREMQVLNRCIDAATSEAVRQYWQLDEAASERQTAQHLGSVAHELRNALAGAKMAFDAVQSGRTPVIGRTADVVRRNLDRMQHLVERQLDDAKRHGSRGEHRPLRLGPFLRGMAEETPLTRGVTITVDVTESIEIDADAQLLASAIGNLIANAVKFTQDATTVVVRGYERDGHAVIEVADQCGGLPSGELGDLFRPFVQAGGDRSGAGLGLSIVRKAVAEHGGTVDVVNHPGFGCVFSVRIPAACWPKPGRAFRD
jgi:signal transduction histidine kinase